MKINIKLLIIISGLTISGVHAQSEPDILPESVLAFPFGSEDYKKRIEGGLEKAFIWSEKKLMAWTQGQGFMVTKDHPDGGVQYHRGIIFHPPGLDFVLKTPISPRGDKQQYGWKLVLDLGVFHAHPFEEALSTDFKYYENIIRYEIYIDNIYYKTVEIGYGISLESPVNIEIPYVRDLSGLVHISLRMKYHPANFGILYDAFLTL